jgi:hypothetical protein
MKKPSLKAVIQKDMADKESFIFNHDTNIPLKRYNGKTVKQDTGDTKKMTCYIPPDLWIKYKSWELDQIKQGKTVIFNKLVLSLLEDKLKDY